MDWSEVSARVVVEACSAHPEDVVLMLGLEDPTIVWRLAPHVRRIVVIDPDASRIEAARSVAPENVELRVGPITSPPRLPGVSVVLVHDTLRRHAPAVQRALVRSLGELVPARALLVVGDVMWSLPVDLIDEPEQYGDALEHVQETRTVERWVREAGFLPDLHRFGPAVAVMIALKA